MTGPTRTIKTQTPPQTSKRPTTKPPKKVWIRKNRGQHKDSYLGKPTAQTRAPPRKREDEDGKIEGGSETKKCRRVSGESTSDFKETQNPQATKNANNDSPPNEPPRSILKDVTNQDIGGCDIQKQEIHEAIEIPLTHHELYKQIGIDPLRGVLLYGPLGTNKTML
ncbi:hypothetical protein LWI29_028901 [Acer saccharum]|uniref:ATPase AAA-type core domain-containing protein n=1 Tax=Acer saccharum TaxID=4024 RepID=A0AA39RX02_ACESA|nr:hypothetical protein LWI29_028901 [Acer saccharum]